MMLPIHREGNVANPRGDRSPPSRVRSRAAEAVRVLFIEDDHPSAEMYRLRLELEGYRVSVVDSAEEGLLRARTTQPDIIFVGIRPPALTGFTALDGLRSDPTTRKSRVVILSDYGESDLIHRGLQLGALDYLIKSETTPSELSRRIGSWLRDDS
jgi:DNA-binding response OmpR family regulator